MKLLVVVLTCLCIFQMNVPPFAFASDSDDSTTPTESDSDSGEKAAPFKFPPVIPAKADGSQNPGFQFPQIGPEEQKCFTSFLDKGEGDCLQDLGNSFQTQKITLTPGCCTFLANIDGSCKPVVHFGNPFFEALIKDHCSHQSSSTSTSTSTPSDPATSDSP